MRLLETRSRKELVHIGARLEPFVGCEETALLETHVLTSAVSYYSHLLEIIGKRLFAV